MANVKEIQFKKLARGLFVKIISLRESTQKGRRPKLKSMYVQVYKAFEAEGYDPN